MYVLFMAKYIIWLELKTFQIKYQSLVQFTLVWRGEKVENGKRWKEKDKSGKMERVR